jgi:Flp pilus assembly protein TadG
MVEFAVVVPLLAVLLFGGIEFGHAWDSKLKVETAARAGARVGSSLGSARLADYNLLQSVKSALNDIGLENVDYVTVYKSTTVNGEVPASCGGEAPISVVGTCNVYTNTQLENLDLADFAGTTSCTPGSPDAAWCPTTRQDVQHLGADYIGVWIKADAQTITNLFGSPLDIGTSAVSRVEPRG